MLFWYCCSAQTDEYICNKLDNRWYMCTSLRQSVRSVTTFQHVFTTLVKTRLKVTIIVVKVDRILWWPCLELTFYAWSYMIFDQFGVILYKVVLVCLMCNKTQCEGMLFISCIPSPSFSLFLFFTETMCPLLNITYKLVEKQQKYATNFWTDARSDWG